MMITHRHLQANEFTIKQKTLFIAFKKIMNQTKKNVFKINILIATMNRKKSQ